MSEKTFKVGDKVAFYSRSYFHSDTTIQKITPTGIIKTADGHSFRPDGSLRSSESFYWGRIERWTEKHTGLQDKQSILDKLKSFNFGRLRVSQLRELKALLDRFVEDEKNASQAPSNAPGGAKG